jgi:glutamyl-tRNA reductase
LMNKFLHMPMQAIKAAALEADTVMLEVMRTVFNLSAAQETANSRVAVKPGVGDAEEAVIVGNPKDRS